MARSWTRLHAHLGVPPGAITYDMVAKAVADRLEETDDLDWKEALPQPPQDGRWNEFAKDVAAMANTRGGLLIYGVSNDVRMTGINPQQVLEQQLRQWVRNHVQPYVSGLSFLPLASDDGSHSVLVVDVPASVMAPHLVYGTAAKDKAQQAAVAPYRDGSHTDWMPEHLIARAYQDRFARQAAAEAELQEHLQYAADIGLHASQAVWIVIASRPQRPLPRMVPPLDLSAALRVVEAGLRTSVELKGEANRVMAPVLRSVNPTPRRGLRRWVISNTLPASDSIIRRPVFVELHHDGTTVLAADLSWKALERLEGTNVTCPVPVDAVASAAFEAVALAAEFRRALLDDSASDVTALVVAPPDYREPFVPVVREMGTFVTIPDYARRPPRLLPATSEIPAAADADVLRSVAEELRAGIVNQFGLE
ncbi:ATP-binding protein [Streptomyces lunaelactis]|uniref:AlbA family DNA-binding domain-containing protein n=1 Tax=Streptomyces lunaelactis TaxID=1535768 RepID=UPI0015849677|nr:ATP-binding protein [Streptomyces lunaelactis]NUK07823.1 ATP-binding protein [Streptomyces lunaelactis]NUK34134.1 ATP-binding protein [Streptomyces lunaelactis]NUK52289.1 ATP-binding protein [Streptomyces lunaelactis]NUK63956.1 ATP-binding protein [Streptomyces lunaelactis]NUK72955.1 ATP-binding protein [Streptomyces lunaelactis]